MRTVLVIGGTGTIGGAVARHLLAAGWRVTVTGRRPREVPDGVTLVLADHDTLPGGEFDLVVDCACYTAEHARQVLPLMRDGTQWRPMLHVHDAARALIFMLQAPGGRINGEVLNVGSEADNHRLAALAELIRAALPVTVEIGWYGDPDRRSYRIDCRRIEALGWRAEAPARTRMQGEWLSHEDALGALPTVGRKAVALAETFAKMA